MKRSVSLLLTLFFLFSASACHPVPEHYIELETRVLDIANAHSVLIQVDYGELIILKSEDSLLSIAGRSLFPGELEYLTDSSEKQIPALPFWAGFQRTRRFFATNLRGFSRIFETNPCEFVKSVAELLGFPVKNGRTQIMIKVFAHRNHLSKVPLQVEVRLPQQMQVKVETENASVLAKGFQENLE